MTQTTASTEPIVPTVVTETLSPQMPWAPPVIFLDWDGVLALPDGEWCPEAVAELNRLCLETGASIVLTTSFRYSGSVKALRRGLGLGCWA